VLAARDGKHGVWLASLDVELHCVHLAQAQGHKGTALQYYQHSSGLPSKELQNVVVLQCMHGPDLRVKSLGQAIIYLCKAS